MYTVQIIEYKYVNRSQNNVIVSEYQRSLGEKFLHCQFVIFCLRFYRAEVSCFYLDCYYHKSNLSVI